MITKHDLDLFWSKYNKARFTERGYKREGRDIREMLLKNPDDRVVEMTIKWEMYLDRKLKPNGGGIRNSVEILQAGPLSLDEEDGKMIDRHIITMCLRGPRKGKNNHFGGTDKVALSKNGNGKGEKHPMRNFFRRYLTLIEENDGNVPSDKAVAILWCNTVESVQGVRERAVASGYTCESMECGCGWRFHRDNEKVEILALQKRIDGIAKEFANANTELKRLLKSTRGESA